MVPRTHVCGPLFVGEELEMTQNTTIETQFLQGVLSSGKPTEEFTGTVVETGKKGFCYIDNVRDSNNFPVDTTAGDVYLAEDDLIGGKITVGAKLSFQIMPDPQRKGCLKAFKAHSSELALVRATEVPAFPVSVRTGEITYFHANMRKVPAPLVTKARENQPFKDMPRPTTEEMAKQFTNQDMLAAAFSEWLRVKFAMLMDFDVMFDITAPETGDGEEAKRITEFVTSYAANGMESAGAQLRDSYQTFVNVRATFRFLYKKKLLLPQVVLPTKYLPHLFVAAPVVYVKGKEQIANVDRQPDPKVDHFVEHICKLGKTQQFADLFQMYNRRSRGFEKYGNGMDVIPPHIWGIIKECMATEGHKARFDYLTIWTPYHNVASDEWADPNWAKLIDPYLVAFSKDIPDFCFVLGRWSDTGIFPGVDQMVGATMEHLETHKGMLGNFGSMPFWFMFDMNTGDSLRNHSEPPGASSGGSFPPNTPCVLLERAEETLKHFREGTLFPWLAGESLELSAEVKEKEEKKNKKKWF